MGHISQCVTDTSKTMKVPTWMFNPLPPVCCCCFIPDMTGIINLNDWLTGIMNTNDWPIEFASLARVNHSQLIFIPDVTGIDSLLTMGANIEDMERCFEHFEIKDDDTRPEEEFEVTKVSRDKTKSIIGENKYLNGLVKGSGLEILKKNLVQQVYEDRKERGLFHLFFNQSCLESIQIWTNDELLRKGKKNVSKKAFNA